MSDLFQKHVVIQPIDWDCLALTQCIAVPSISRCSVILLSQVLSLYKTIQSDLLARLRI